MTLSFDYKKYIKPAYVLALIVLLGAVLRFLGLGSADLFHDEGFYAFRSIGYFDYVQNDDQSTPVQWFRDGELPFWTRLSFHDHPPLFFLIQYAFSVFLGDSLFAMRLPSAIFGLATIVFAYLVARRILKDDWLGVVAALFLSISQIHIWVSRSSIMESVLIALIFLNLLAFLRLLDDSKKWLAFGATLGLAFLTKYTAVFLIPVYVVYLLVYRRDLFANWRLYAGAVLALVVFSPVIIYNFYLYQAVGHFDLQLSYFLGQSAPEWRASLGKVQEPFGNIGINMINMYSIPFMAAWLLGLAGSFWVYIKTGNKFLPLAWFAFAFITLMLAGAGSAYRFIALYVLPGALFMSLFIGLLKEKLKFKHLAAFITGALIAYELAFAVEGIFIAFPDFGVRKLDQYLDGIFDGRRPLSVPQSPNPHLNKVIQDNLYKYPATAKPATIIYDENISLSPRLWLFSRRQYYRGIPSMSSAYFKEFLRKNGPDYFKNYVFYFVKATPNTVLNPELSVTAPNEFENFLQKEFSLKPERIITGHRGLPMFYIYKFSF